MLTISLVGQKGGGGKSTLCWILVQAILSRPERSRTLLVDTDPQGSTLGFVDGAVTAYPSLKDRLACIAVRNSDDLAATLEKAPSDGFDFVFIDTAGKQDDFPRDVMSMSDRVIIPVKPVLHEYRSQVTTVETCEAVRKSFIEAGQRPPAYGLLLNNVRESAKLTLEQKEAMSVIVSDPHILPFYMPYKSSYETLGRGRVLIEEWRSLNKPGDAIKRGHLLSDLKEANLILTSIEGME